MKTDFAWQRSDPYLKISSLTKSGFFNQYLISFLIELFRGLAMTLIVPHPNNTAIIVLTLC